jgi:hypothetical protein
VRWLVGNRLLRILAVAIALMNLTLSATLSLSVLYAQERLGLGSVGYGLLLSSMAVGGISASLVADRVIGWLGPAATMRLGLVIESSTHLVLAPGPQPAAGRGQLRPVRLPRHDLERDQRVAAPGADPGPAAGPGQQRLRAVRVRLAVAGRGRRRRAGRPVRADGPFWCSFAAMSALTVACWPVLSARAIAQARAPTDQPGP